MEDGLSCYLFSFSYSFDARIFCIPWLYNAGQAQTMEQTEIIFSVQESPEGGYEARALGFSIFTQADTLDELKTMIRDAVSCHFENGQKPSVIRLASA